MNMIRSKSILTAAVLASLGLAVGCASTKKDETAENANAKYKILSGNTGDATASAQGKGKTVDAAEPALNVETRFAAGRLAETQGRFDCAIVQYEQAVRLKSDHVPSLYRLGVVNTKLKQYDKAVAYWKKYIKATGDLASGYSNLGFCYEMAGRVEEAEAAYKEGLQRDPNNVPCRTNYGLMLARNNRVTEAEVQLSAVLKPDEVSYNLASVYEQQGAMAQAREALKKAIEINPANVEAQSKLANISLTE
jgi:tetratricopeptide (TPR) repeat protein